MRQIVKKYKNSLGLGMVYAGVLMMVVSFLLDWTNYNAVLAIEIILIIAGVITHYYILKKASKY